MRWVRQGMVSSRNAEEMTVRVAFDGLDTIVSEELPILIPPSSTQMYHMPEVGDNVLCVFADSRGYCIGMLQTVIPEAKAGDWGVWFDDDQFITFTKDTIQIQGKKIALQGQVTLSGNLKVEGTITGKGKLEGCCTHS